MSGASALPSGSQPPPLRSTSFQGKEGEPRMPLSPYCHFRGKRYENAASPLLSFRANARNLFRLRSRRSGRKAENGKHRASCDWGSRRFIQAALRRKTETGNEKDPSAALGMTKRDRYISHSFSIRHGSQPTPLRGTSFRRKEGGGRMVKAIYPLSVEGGCPKGRGLASFFAAKPPSLSLPPWGRGPRQRWIGCSC